MSNSAARKIVKGDWDTSTIRAEILKSVATVYRSLNTILAEDAKLAEEAAKAILTNKLYYSGLDIDSPHDLAIAVAEYTTNIFGIKVSILQNGGKSTIVFENGAFVDKLVTTENLSPEVSEKLVNSYKNGLADLGGYYGYVTEVVSIQPDFIVSFSK